MAVPSQASRYAESAVIWSSPITTRLGGAIPLSECQSAERFSPFSSHSMWDGAALVLGEVLECMLNKYRTK
jgi:hypothetical protein